MSSREQFEAWMTAEQWFHGSDFEWDERRNCYSQFGIHLAYKAWVAATKQSEDKCAALAAELNAVEAIHDDAVFITDDHYEQCPPEVQKIIRSLAVMQITAYKAFLAEVRAQGVEMFAGEVGDHSKGKSQATAEIIKATGRNALRFAAKLRQDANIAELEAAGIITKVVE